jgi:hypothetical protein
MNNDAWFRFRAKELYQEEGEIEIDDNARVSAGSKEGSYVQAWVWVPAYKEKPTARTKQQSA